MNFVSSLTPIERELEAKARHAELASLAEPKEDRGASERVELESSAEQDMHEVLEHLARKLVDAEKGHAYAQEGLEKATLVVEQRRLERDRYRALVAAVESVKL